MEKLRQEIEVKNTEILRLEKEARQFREEIAKTQQTGKTLQEELKRIERTVAQFRREIRLTEGQIQKTELEIQELGLEIKEKELSLSRLRAGVSDALRILAEQDQETMVMVLLRDRNLSDFFHRIEQAQVLERQLLASVGMLKGLHAELTAARTTATGKKENLENLQTTLRGRRGAQETIQRERSTLLTETRNQERRYQQLLAERERQRAALEDEIRGIEEKIRVTIDPSSLPRKGSGVLGWPLEGLVRESCWSNGNRGDWRTDPRHCITQYFGYTSFAAIGGYDGKGHNGVDFRASPGTPIFATGEGVVVGVGDTDTGCPRASYGKWILLQHPNNLSTLYAHLSSVQVASGQNVRRGQVIGFSGSSGYATGPHLHLGVFATPAVEIRTIRSRVCGRGITLPIAAVNGYLNPLDYL